MVGRRPWWGGGSGDEEAVVGRRPWWGGSGGEEGRPWWRQWRQWWGGEAVVEAVVGRREGGSAKVKTRKRRWLLLTSKIAT